MSRRTPLAVRILTVVVGGLVVLAVAVGSVAADENGPVDVEQVATPSVDRGAVRVAVSGPAMSRSGDLVEIEYAVDNLGPGSLRHVFVKDDVLGPVGKIASLGVGNVRALTATFVLPPGVPSVTNTATACGSDQAGLFVCDTDSHTLRVINPAVSLAVTADPPEVNGQGEVTYSYAVANSGDVALSPVSVVDDVHGAIGEVASLAPGAAVTLSKTVTVTSESPTTVVATATGTDPAGGVVTASGDVAISVVLGTKVVDARVTDPVNETRAAGSVTDARVTDPASTPPSVVQVLGIKTSLPVTGAPLAGFLAAGLWMLAAGSAMCRTGHRYPASS